MIPLRVLGILGRRLLLHPETLGRLPRKRLLQVGRFPTPMQSKQRAEGTTEKQIQVEQGFIKERGRSGKGAKLHLLLYEMLMKMVAKMS